ncbi:MAG TPA: 16S rRNA (cytosine(967)-C(5))-methyltransferase [Leptolyngbyaceae cyanobacterium M65_K2018_010]|nr:16S rRNA (cytosine(967)-C(5))-methyltransferase [Leptolyngbyaceae cyanobacterium M65_K2018_010]
MPPSARQLALTAILQIRGGAYADVALHRVLAQHPLPEPERALATELVYGTVRRQRTLDALITQLGTRPAEKQPPVLRAILQLGLYQLRYLAIPAAAAVTTSVDLAKEQGLGPLTKVVNGLLRQYQRLAEAKPDPLILPPEVTAALGIRHSYPDWLIALWIEQLGCDEAEQLGQWFNQVPSIDLRVNCQQKTVAEVQAAFEAGGMATQRLPGLPWALRLSQHSGALTALPGYGEGWWSVQDASAQLVGQLLNPQPGETVVDVCAAPGGKATHLAEMMGDSGTVWACDRTPSRLKKVAKNCDRLRLTSVRTHLGDSTHLPQFHGQGDRVLVDAPCSGLGTLHRHADARWRQTPETIQSLIPLQQALLEEAARCVKAGGVLVYATCTLHPAENEEIVRSFLHRHSTWQVHPPEGELPPGLTAAPEGWLKVWPHRHHRDGFFMVRLSPELRLRSG